MSTITRSRRLRGALTAGLAVAVLSGAAAPLTLAPATAADRRDSLASTQGQKLLTVTFDELDEVVPGEDLTVTGSVSKVTQARIGRVGDAVAATFTLQLVDATGEVLATEEVVAEPDGSFATTVPASLLAEVERAVGNVEVREVPAVHLDPERRRDARHDRHR